MDPAAMTEEEQIRRAIELSMGMTTEANSSTDPSPADNADDNDDDDDDDDEDDDEAALLIQQALAMSAQDALSDNDNDNDNDDEDEDEDDDDAAIQAALKASMAETTDTTDDTPDLPAPTETSDANAETFSDPNYVKSLLEGIPGASLNDPLIQVSTL